jgi:hypothetical protein
MVGVEYLDAVGEEGDGIEREGAREGVGGLGRAGLDGKALDYVAGVRVGGNGVAADLRGQGSFDGEVVGGFGGGGPVQLHLVAHALGCEVFD